MKNFNLKKYLTEGHLLKEDNLELSIFDQDEKYVQAVVKRIKKYHPNISDEDLKKAIERANKSFFGDNVSAGKFAGEAMEYYEDALMSSEDYEAFMALGGR